MCISERILGFLFFLLTALSSWGPAVEAWQISEYEGEGELSATELAGLEPCQQP